MEAPFSAGAKSGGAFASHYVDVTERASAIRCAPVRPSFRLFALAVTGSIVAACGSDPDLKDTRPRDGAVFDVTVVDVESEIGADSEEIEVSADDTAPIEDSTVVDSGMLEDSAPGVDTSFDSFMPPADTGTGIDTFMPPADTGTGTDTSFDTFMPPADTGTGTDTSFDSFMPPPDSGTGIDTSFDSFTPPPDSGTGADTRVDSFVPPPMDSSSAVDSFLDPDTGTDDTGEEDTFIDPGDSDIEEIPAPPKFDAASTGFSHTINIDGANDFTAHERFATTSGGYTAYVTWNSSHVFIGYEGPGVASGTKSLMIYFDTTTGGATLTEQRNIMFPNGFAPDAHFRWSRSSTVDAVVAVSKSGNFVELAIPLSSIGATNKLGIATFIIDSATESTFAGLYSPSFIDGYSSPGAPKPIMHWLDATLSLPTPPNDPSRQKN